MSAKPGDRSRSKQRRTKVDPIPGSASPLGPSLVPNSPADDDIHPIRELLPHHREQLVAGSGISEEVIAERGYFSATNRADLERLGFAHYQRRVPSLVIPIRDVHGHVVTWMCRPDSPRVSKRKLLKYETPKDTCVYVDVPARVHPFLGNPAKPIWITEGTKKADSAASRGLTCVSISGVWNWRGSNEDGGTTVLPDWDSIALKDREVILAFDSDVMTKDGVLVALNRLRRVLESRKAKVRICLLPEGPDGAKTGLDDFFARGGTVADLEACIVNELPKDRAITDEAGIYTVRADGVFMNVERDGEPTVCKVMNFDARIVEEVHRDDGAETTIQFDLEVTLGGRQRRLKVPAREFRELDWIHSQVGSGAIVEVGHNAQRVCHAVQTLSNPKFRRIFTHTGWRKIDDSWCYLHGDGAIGPVGPLGPLAGTGIELPDSLHSYRLPPVPAGIERAASLRDSISLSRVGPGHIGWLLLLATYRAALGEATFSVFLLGFTGTRKSSTAAVCLQHFGPTFALTNLPGNWSSTANASEELMFAVKDALFVIDDFIPPSGTDRGRHDASADRLLRNAANRAGRQRMNADGSLRPNRPPRGLTLATGEVLPRGHSLLARVLVAELGVGDINLAELTRLQTLGANGTLAKAMAAFIQWLSPQYEAMQLQLRHCTNSYRSQLHLPGAHGRTVDALAELWFTLDLLLRFAVEAGAHDAAQAQVLRTEAQSALLRVGGNQAAQQLEEDVASAFMRQLRAAIAAGRAHLVSGHDSISPPQGTEIACGWRASTPEPWIATHSHSRWLPQGEHIGWIDGGDAYLLPDVAEAAALKLARERGEPINITGRGLRKRLKEAGILGSTGRGDSVERFMTRKMFGGARHEVMHLAAASLLDLRVDHLDQVDQLSTAPDPGAPSEPQASSGSEWHSLGVGERTPTADGAARDRGAPTSPCWVCRGTTFQRARNGPWTCSTCQKMPTTLLHEEIDISGGAS